MESLKATGRAAMQRGDHPSAIGAFEQALGLAASDVWLLDVLGFLYFCQGRFTEARDCCLRSIELLPTNHYAHKGLGLCLARLGDPAAGVAALRRSIELDPSYADAHHDLGVVLSEIGQSEEAERCFARARALR
ncbi:MAG: tetratricopeptide repeat protein [Polyangiaceae bacterium]|nr:tetratricopeptide repeat protein [Polyangiaceae bacterium]